MAEDSSRLTSSAEAAELFMSSLPLSADGISTSISASDSISSSAEFSAEMFTSEADEVSFSTVFAEAVIPIPVMERIRAQVSIAVKSLLFKISPFFR